MENYSEKRENRGDVQIKESLDLGFKHDWFIGNFCPQFFILLKSNLPMNLRMILGEMGILVQKSE